MSSLLQQLENNEAVLLMYLCGELPPEDRAEVEQLLGRDAGLAAELQRLRELHGQCVEAIERMDESQRLRTGPAERQAVRAVRAWHLQRQLAIEPEPELPAASHRWWLSSAAAVAASLLIGLMVWWSYSPVSAPQPYLVVQPRPFTSMPFYESPVISEHLALAQEQSLMLSRLDMDEPLFPFMELIEEATN
jgi:anti-sigma factor RsiW